MNIGFKILIFLLVVGVVGYCPDCVKTWKERNGAEFDEEYADPERMFVTWFCDEMAWTIEFQREILERYAQE